MAYVAQKPCCFAGQRFKIGEAIPDELIHPGAVETNIKMGVIAKQGGTKAPRTTATIAPAISVKVNTEKGTMALNLTPEGLQSVVTVLTGKAIEAEAVIEEITDGDALILLHMCDSRKTIKAAAEARGKALEEVGEP